MKHISDYDLERYDLGQINDEAELAPFEEHLVACAECAQRAEEASEWVDMIRAAIILGDFDLPNGTNSRPQIHQPKAQVAITSLKRFEPRSRI